MASTTGGAESSVSGDLFDSEGSNASQLKLRPTLTNCRLQRSKEARLSGSKKESRRQESDLLKVDYGSTAQPLGDAGEGLFLTPPANDVKLTDGDIARFWSHVDKSGPVSEVLGTRCWLWTGSTTNRGYGQFMVGHRPDRVNVPAHAVSLAIHGVVVPPGHERRHLCGIKPCVNPEHVKPGTHRENMNDHYPHNAALTFEEAEQLRKEYRSATVKGGKSRVCERWAAAKGITFRCAQYAAMGTTYKTPHLQPKRNPAPSAPPTTKEVA